MINIIAEVELLFDEIACGKVIFMRTDTIYGLVADSCNVDAINGIYHIKNRSKSKTLPLFFPSIQMIREYAVIPDTIDLFMRHFLPGAITVILKLKEGVAFITHFMITRQELLLPAYLSMI